MALIVQKYGGTPVADAERIKSVAKRIARTRDEGNQVVVVVSAMGDTTDELIQLAYQISEKPDNRELDVLLSTGESRLHELFAGFWRSASPEQFAGVEAEAFGRYLLGHGGDIPHLGDILALELAALRAGSIGTAQQVLLSCDHWIS